MIDETKLLEKALRYCEKTGVSLNILSRRIVKRPYLFTRIQEGKSCTIASFNKANDWLDDAMKGWK